VNISFLTNGYGEDRTGALIACELRQLAPHHPIVAIPMVSNGDAFQKHGFETVWEGSFPPGQGFGSQEFRLFLKDIPYARDYFRYLGFLARQRSQINHAFVVGDVFLLIHAYFGLGRKSVFLALAKSDHMNPHSGIEEWVIRNFASRVLTRDAYTAERLRAKGIDARFLGNPIMDGIGEPGPEKPSVPPIISLFPGSRDEAAQNFQRIIAVIDQIAEPVQYLCALSPVIDIAKMAESVQASGWVLTEENVLRKGDKTVALGKDLFERSLHDSTLVIGMAGTANEQAAGMGRPVISFVGAGAQTTPSRMIDQERLLGGAAAYISDFPEGVSREISWLLAHPEERERRGAIGRQRMGPPGGAKKIAEFLFEEFGLR
jgi:uncharacterized protein (TIGR03492 family)